MSLQDDLCRSNLLFYKDISYLLNILETMKHRPEGFLKKHGWSAQPFGTFPSFLRRYDIRSKGDCHAATTPALAGGARVGVQRQETLDSVFIQV
jgi:hypothetical protein